MKMRMREIDMNNGAASAHSAGFGGAPSAVRALLQAAATVALWRARHRDRRAIAALDDHMLRDIGIDRVAAEEVSARPFWKA